MDLYLTDTNQEVWEEWKEEGVGIHHRRFGREDLMSALGPVEDRKNAVAYVCGPAAMTDGVVKVLEEAEGMEKERVLCEKWW